MNKDNLTAALDMLSTATDLVKQADALFKTEGLNFYPISANEWMFHDFDELVKALGVPVSTLHYPVNSELQYEQHFIHGNAYIFKLKTAEELR